MFAVVEKLAQVLRKRAEVGDDVAIGRVVRVEGFSTLPGGDDGVVVVDRDGAVEGGTLAAMASEQLAQAGRDVLKSGRSRSVTEVTVDIGDKEAVANGLACGGRVDLVLQAAAAIPSQLWDSLAARSPVALLSRMEGPEVAVVASNGRVFGPPPPDELLESAEEAFRAGRSTSRIIEHEASRFLLEAWVPEPRLTVVGGGELLDAIHAQAALLGWETRDTDGLAGLDDLFAWSGQSAALIVLSHDPQVDVPALAAGLNKGVAYIGALGSRRTQSRRMDQLAAVGVEPSELARVHRPIGLDLGGRRAPEVALAIVAEILACHYGRTAMPLKETSGPIHG